MLHSFASYGYIPPFLMGILAFLGPILALWVLVVLILKGYSLWHAAKRGEVWWFVALLVLNTLGILELFYILSHLKHSPSDVVNNLKKAPLQKPQSVPTQEHNSSQ